MRTTLSFFFLNRKKSTIDATSIVSTRQTKRTIRAGMAGSRLCDPSGGSDGAGEDIGEGERELMVTGMGQLCCWGL